MMQINVVRQSNQENNSLSMIFTLILIILMLLQVFMGNSYLYIHNKVHYGSLLSFQFSTVRSALLFFTILYSGWLLSIISEYFITNLQSMTMNYYSSSWHDLRWAAAPPQVAMCGRKLRCACKIQFGKMCNVRACSAFLGVRSAIAIAILQL